MINYYFIITYDAKLAFSLIENREKVRFFTTQKEFLIK